jgi:hypothetical protein
MIDNSYAVQGLVGLVGVIVLLILGSVFIEKMFTKSRQYRKMMVDMFVVGKTKQIATKEGLDLQEELRDFAKFMKYKEIDCESLDTTIERELQEKIANVSLTEKEKK